MWFLERKVLDPNVPYIKTQTDVPINDNIGLLFISTPLLPKHTICKSHQTLQHIKQVVIYKKSQKNSIKSDNCSHIWLVDIPKCKNYSDKQSMKVWWRYNTSEMICMKILKEHAIK